MAAGAMRRLQGLRRGGPGGAAGLQDGQGLPKGVRTKSKKTIDISSRIAFSVTVQPSPSLPPPSPV